MNWQLIILILVGFGYVCTNGKQLLGGDTDDNQDYITTDVHSQTKIHVEDSKHLPGDTGSNQDYLYSGVYNQRKMSMKQGSLRQPEYYEYRQRCPAAEDISPCVCTYFNTETKAMDLDCSVVDNEDQLRQIFNSHFPFKNFRKFLIQGNSNLKVMESSVFNDINFEIIEINHSNLEIIELFAFYSCHETTYELDFSANKITSFPFNELSQFSKLIYFTMWDNPSLNMIPTDAFNGLTTLESLDLSGNTPNIVGTFKNLPNLKQIFLYSNKLTAIPSGFLNTGSSKLKYIGLDDNAIASVEPGAFNMEGGMVEGGMVIYMDWNALSTLEEATWHPILEAGWGLEAYANPLSCDCDIAWMFEEDYLFEQVYAQCIDGVFIQDLDPSIFDNC